MTAKPSQPWTIINSWASLFSNGAKHTLSLRLLADAPACIPLLTDALRVATARQLKLPTASIFSTSCSGRGRLEINLTARMPTAAAASLARKGVEASIKARQFAPRLLARLSPGARKALKGLTAPVGDVRSS